MRKAQALVYLAALAAGITLMVMAIDVSPDRLLSNAARPAETQRRDPLIDKIYKISFRFESTNIQSANLYIPVYKPVSADEAGVYAALFGFEFAAGFTEDGDCYVYADGARRLRINRYMSEISYEGPKEAAEGERADETDAIKTAGDFLKEKAGMSSYISVLAAPAPNGGFEITFTDKLNSFESRCFNNKVLVSEYGSVIAAEINFFEFERIGNCPLLTMRQCYDILPTDFEDADIRIDLKKASLVYIFENSIVQPAYLFEGETNAGEGFSCYVPAARFD